MRVPHALRVDGGADRYADLLAALRAAGLRFGWLEWDEPSPLPAALREAAAHGALRAVAAGDRLTAAVKPRRGPAVVRDLVREHFRGCAVVFIQGAAPAAVTLHPDDDRWTLTAPDGKTTTVDTDPLIARLNSPRPLLGSASAPAPSAHPVSPISDEAAARHFLPGPSWVRPAIRQAMTAPVVAHRSPSFRALYARLAERLPPLFRTAGEVFVATSSATLMMEAAVVSCVERDVLHLVGGAFSERWLAIARSHGKTADLVSVPWGEAIDPAMVARALARKRYEAVTAVHCETSTGVLNPLAEIAAAVRRESDALLLVDAVSSLAGAPVETDRWGLDVVVTGSQKALALPPGLALAAVSERAAERAAAVSGRGFYTDLLRYRDKHRAGGTITTPCEPLFFALDRQLEEIGAEGVEERWRRHAELARTTRTWAAERGCTPASTDPFHSPTVTCLRPPDGVGAGELVAAAAERGYTVAGGYGEWEGDTVRIGHMGDVGPADLQGLLAALDSGLAELRG